MNYFLISDAFTIVQHVKGFIIWHLVYVSETVPCCMYYNSMAAVGVQLAFLTILNVTGTPKNRESFNFPNELLLDSSVSKVLLKEVQMNKEEQTQTPFVVYGGLGKVNCTSAAGRSYFSEIQTPSNVHTIIPENNCNVCGLC